MRPEAAVSHWAFKMRLATDYLRTYLTSICSKWSSSIFLGFVIKEAFLRIMLIWNFALLSLKIIQINVADDIISRALLRVSLQHTHWEDS
jgi:hypothetical protein